MKTAWASSKNDKCRVINYDSKSFIRFQAGIFQNLLKIFGTYSLAFICVRLYTPSTEHFSSPAAAAAAVVAAADVVTVAVRLRAVDSVTIFH